MWEGWRERGRERGMNRTHPVENRESKRGRLDHIRMVCIMSFLAS